MMARQAITLAMSHLWQADSAALRSLALPQPIKRGCGLDNHSGDGRNGRQSRQNSHQKIVDKNAGTTVTETTTLAPYSGGDIQLAAENVVYGSILAGNLFRTGGKTTLYGYVVSSALAKKNAVSGGGVIYNDGGLGLPKTG